MRLALPIELTYVLSGRSHFCLTKAAVPSSGNSSCTDGAVGESSSSAALGSITGAKVLDMSRIGKKGCTNCSVRVSSGYVSSPADVSNSRTRRLAPSSSASKVATTALPMESSNESGSAWGLPMSVRPSRTSSAAATSDAVWPAAVCAASSIAEIILLGSRTFWPSSRRASPERSDSNCCLRADARAFSCARSRSKEERTTGSSSLSTARTHDLLLRMCAHESRECGSSAALCNARGRRRRIQTISRGFR
mmetsp:Transcript_28006/g.60302  ORF Transcript_28006/g.60302 Transcript_28006/m.60302 type:complete len:250 (+) Transcript_28006:549-1298(+)